VLGGCRRDRSRSRDRGRDRDRDRGNGSKAEERDRDRDRGKGRDRERDREPEKRARSPPPPPPPPPVVAETQAKRRPAASIMAYVREPERERAIKPRDREPTRERERDRGPDLHRPNADALAGVLNSHNRTNARMDAREREAAAMKLRRMDDPGNKEIPGGRVVRDEYARGVRADVTVKKKHPYQCDKCDESYAMAPALSDHLKQAHNVFKHPSQLLPTLTLFVSEEKD
jgi:hypothetical protein